MDLTQRRWILAQTLKLIRRTYGSATARQYLRRQGWLLYQALDLR